MFIFPFGAMYPSDASPFCARSPRQEMVNVHKVMRDKSERNAAENKKACIDAEVSELGGLGSPTEFYLAVSNWFT